MSANTGDQISIVRAQAKDADVLSMLGKETFSSTFGHLYSAEDLNLFLTKHHSLAAYENLLSRANVAAWIARKADGGEAIGFVTATPCGLPVPDMPPRSGEIQRFYIREGHQGGGLGRRMMTEALTWLRTHYDQAYLSVYAENHGAQRFYARHGFEKIHRYHYMVGNQADPEWIMALSFDA